MRQTNSTGASHLSPRLKFFFLGTSTDERGAKVTDRYSKLHLKEKRRCSMEFIFIHIVKIRLMDDFVENKNKTIKHTDEKMSNTNVSKE